MIQFARTTAAGLKAKPPPHNPRPRLADPHLAAPQAGQERVARASPLPSTAPAYDTHVLGKG